MSDTDGQSAITAEVIATAEALFGVRYTAAERTLMLGNIDSQVRSAVARRAVKLPPELGPACRFDPRLPGFRMPDPGPFAWTPAEIPLPAAEDDIAFAPVTALAGWIRSGSLGAERLARLYLDRIARLGPKLDCFATVTAGPALARAAELDRMLASGRWLGPLHGIPYGMKDIIDTAGIETSWGAEPYADRVPETDAHVTVLLHEAGAVMLGKTSVGALAYGDIWHRGRSNNPWNLEEGSSGSSAGSGSATAAGLVGFAIGTETLGSIVSPSLRCGATGLRPSYGRVSRRGAMPLCWSLDKIGPICRGVEDTALVLDAINGADPDDPFQIPAPFGYAADAPIAGLRLGFYPEDFAREAVTEVEHQALEAARGLGFAMVELTRPELPYDSLMAVLYAEAGAAFEELTLSDRDDLLKRQDDTGWPNGFRKARFLSAVDHVQLDRLRRRAMQDMAAAFTQADVIIGPAMVGPMLVITNFTGTPCLCLRAGFRQSPTRGPLSLGRSRLEPGQEKSGPTHRVPQAVCLWGRLYDEGPMLAVGTALEARLGVAAERPPLG